MGKLPNFLGKVGDNKAKNHGIECAYRLALQFGAPTLKTAPGSDFSNLCSLEKSPNSERTRWRLANSSWPAILTQCSLCPFTLRSFGLFIPKTVKLAPKSLE